MNATIRIFLEIGFGAVYLIGAVFHTLYTYRNGETFFGSFARGTWFSPAKWFIEKFVLPNPKPFAMMLILFQLLVAVALLSQGPYVRLGLLAGTAFCMYAVFVSNLPGAIANLVMAVLQFYLASGR